MTRHGGKRDGAGRRPGAVSAARREIAAEAKDHAEAALKVLVDVMGDDNAPHSARISAANAILDRGYGRPGQSIDLNATHDIADPLMELFEQVANASKRIGV